MRRLGGETVHRIANYFFGSARYSLVRSAGGAGEPPPADDERYNQKGCDVGDHVYEIEGDDFLDSRRNRHGVGKALGEAEDEGGGEG